MIYRSLLHTIIKSESPLRSETEIDNAENDSKSVTSFTNSREDKHSFIQSECNDDIKRDDCNFDRGQIT
jgi:hypothetical protein